jgi:N-acetylglutamate synthase-like GNAT family acetyltransferase
MHDLNALTSGGGAVNTLYIHDIAVDPSMRSGGLGAQILEHMIRDAVRLNLPTLTLTAVEGASGYWLRQGFQEIEGIASGYGEGACRMKLSARP